MKLDEIASRIAAHLDRIEADPKLNPARSYSKATKRWVPDEMGVTAYYNASARRSGARIRVGYVSYQGTSALTKDEALAYLAWLDAGNVGTHRQVKP